MNSEWNDDEDDGDGDSKIVGDDGATEQRSQERAVTTNRWVNLIIILD